jgi:molybdopterin synthase catalytic subunit
MRMTITTLFFAHYQDIVGSRERTIVVPDEATVHTLAEQLAREFPALGELLRHGRVAVDEEFAGADTPLRDGAVVAWMPPMSGGA